MLILKVFKFIVFVFYGWGVFNYDVGFMFYCCVVNIVVGKLIDVGGFYGV